MILTFLVPLHIQSVANLREHWAVKAKRVKRERQAIALGAKVHAGAWMPGYLGKVCAGGATITLTRIAPRPIKDTHDNLRSAFKSVVDEVANQLGIDDGDERLTWNYAQERGEYGVRVVIETRDAVAA